MEYVVTGNDYKFKYVYQPIVEFTDVDGRTSLLTNMFLFHKPTLDDYGLTTFTKVFDWIKRNEAGLADLNSPSLNGAIADFILTTCDFSGFIIGQTEVNLMAEFREYVPWLRNNAGVWTCVERHYRESHVNTPSSGFILADTEDQVSTEMPEVRVLPYLRSSWVITFEAVNSSSVSMSLSPEIESMWGQLRNYSFRMDESGYNFFRSTRSTKKQEHEGELYFGMELEACTRLSTQEVQYIVTEVFPKQEPFFIMKDDGSINGQYPNRMELVTVPATPKYLRQAWTTFFKKLERLASKKGKEIKDFFDVNTGLNNGLHIHVNRSSFMNTMHQRKFIHVLNMHDKQTTDFLQSVSGRDNYRGNQYCSPSSSFQGRTIAYNLKNSAVSDGHRGVTSLRSSPTVEVRLFQGIFNLEHVLKCIDFLHALHDYTDLTPFSYLNWRFAAKFQQFVLKSNNYRNFRKELKVCV